MKPKVIIAIIGLVIVVVVGIIGGRYAYQHDGRLYSGKETFLTQVEYTTFKMEVAREEVAVETMYALSSDVPIVVDFTVQVPYDYNFPYGKDVGIAEGNFEVWVMIPTFIIAGLVCFIVLNWPERKESDVSQI